MSAGIAMMVSPLPLLVMLGLLVAAAGYVVWRRRT